MKQKLLCTEKSVRNGLIMAFLVFSQTLSGLNSTDVQVKLISGYFWMDNSCISGGPQGKVVSFRVKNIKGTALTGVSLSLGTIGFSSGGAVTYSSGTPSFNRRTAASVYLGNIAAGDSATAFFYIGYNCLMYANNTNLTTDLVQLPITVSDNLSGTVSQTLSKEVHVIKNSNNNSISILASSASTVGTITTVSVAYNISNVQPNNIIDMELSTLNTFPSGYEIMGCRIASSSITADFPVNLLNTHYNGRITSSTSNGGNVTLEWYLKATATTTGLSSSNVIPYVVSDAGSSQRWQANTIAFTGTSTPVNPITITKRVSNRNVLAGDSVRFTIVIRNSSSTSDVTIDKLVDKLPRDYKFRYIESNTGVFPRLVTYGNSTLVPDFFDTGYLNFNGQKTTGSGISYLVPMLDSIKLIYSVAVSSLPAMNDTNFVSAYIGSNVVASSFASLNVYSFLPLKLLYLKGKKSSDQIKLEWGTASACSDCSFEIYGKADEAAAPELLGFLQAGTNTEFVFTGSQVNMKSLILRVYDANGVYKDFETSLDDLLDYPVKAYVSGDFVVVEVTEPNVSKIQVELFDFTGKCLFTEELISQEGTFRIPLEDIKVIDKLLFLRVTGKQSINTSKILLH